MALLNPEALGAAPQAPPGSPNDRIQIALIGAGGMGQGDVQYELNTRTVALVAVSDIYDGRLTHARERWGKDIFTTRDYREVLARKDVDAVIIATPDHWHSRITIDALAAGKDVYCEKPMVQKVEQGQPVIDAAARASDRIIQIGSQYVSSVIYKKTRQLIQSGAIGELNMVEAWLDRNTALGAWQYSIPTDATPENIDWDRFLGSAPKRPFEPIRLFRWRNYSDYGTAVAGDLFVHLLSGLHFATGSLGPTRVFATGGLRYWKDGRDAPDVMLAMMDYPKSDAHPEFTLALRVNFKSSEPDERFGFRFIGSEGTIVCGPTVTLTTNPKPAPEPNYSIGNFPKALRDEYFAKHPQPLPTSGSVTGQVQNIFTPPAGFDSHTEHHKVFLNAVRTRKPVIEDAVFGFRAAGPALLSNTSYSERRICHWDPKNLKEVQE
jgi:predicted dehydrogenase